MMVIIYTLPNCPQCQMTKRFFQQAQVSFREIDLSQAKQERLLLQAQGYRTVPVVKTPTDEWFGFRLDYLKKAVQEND